MANFGPAIFHLFADSTGWNSNESSPDYNPKPDQWYIDNFGFVAGAAQLNEEFKNTLFRVVMLRIRNQLIKQMIDDPNKPDGKEFDPVPVSLQMYITENATHKRSKRDAAIKVIENVRVEFDLGQDMVDTVPASKIVHNNLKLGCGSNDTAVEGVLDAVGLGQFKIS